MCRKNEPQWVDAAERELIRLSSVPGLRGYIAGIVDRLDKRLWIMPHLVGESREDNLRVELISVNEPDAAGTIVVEFQILPDGATASVLSLKWIPRTQK